MPINNMNSDDIVNASTSAFLDSSDIYDKKIVSKPVPKKEIGIDTENRVIDSIANVSVSSQLDTSSIEQFTRVSQSRDSIYSLIDSMCEDSIISAVLRTYAEDATEKNDSGKIIWAESSDPETASYINYLLDSLNIDKNVFKWATSLCKYGDLYIRLYRQSDYDEDILAKDLENKTGLQESVNVNAYKQNDHYTHYVEMMPNPAEVFELIKFGKSYAYIVAPCNSTYRSNYNRDTSSFNFRFVKKDVDVYGPTEFVHGCLEDMSSRVPEVVSIFMNDQDLDNNSGANTYTVRRGQSLFYNVFKSWRQVSLLQNSIILNRVTKSSVVRTIHVEVGDMAKEEVGPHLQQVKQLFEQKSALNSGESLDEYTNPGPIENNVYIPTRGGQGSLTVGQVGGDVNVGQLTDLEYFRDVMFGSLGIPKQYFGFTEDGAGFNGGQSLSIISSRYGKSVKRIQATLCRTVTDIINILLLDKGLSTYINKFTLKMVSPTTQEELDRRENITNKVRLVSDVMNTLVDVTDPLVKLKILKSMLSESLLNTEVAELLQQEIDKLEGEEYEEPKKKDQVDETEGSKDVTYSNDEMPGDINYEPEDDTSDQLPKPEDLGIDFTDSSSNNF